MVGDVARMPILSTFFGITVRMYFAELGPPHVHVAYQGWEALVAIMMARCSREDCQGVRKRWSASGASTTLSKLEQNWMEAQALRSLARIPGADNN